jgi:plastocyanin
MIKYYIATNSMLVYSGKLLVFTSLILLALLFSITSHPLSPLGYSSGLLGKVIDKVSGGDDDDKGSDDDDKGSDDDDKGSDDDDKGSDDDDKGSDDDDKGSDDKGSDDLSSDEKKGNGPNEGNTGRISSVATGQVVGKDQILYVLIRNENNQTEFVPDEVTLTTGSKVIWMNDDDDLDHSITVGSGSKSEYSLLNSLILPGGMVEHEFDSEGTYFYSDLDHPQSKGTITVLDDE